MEVSRRAEEIASSKRPVLVHCSAGVGRTGCFLAISLGIRQLDAENHVDIVHIVCNLRRERGGMIQTLEQYEFIYRVLAYYCSYYMKFPMISMNNKISNILNLNATAFAIEAAPSSCSPTLSVAVSSPNTTCVPLNGDTSFTFSTQQIQWLDWKSGAFRVREKERHF